MQLIDRDVFQSFRVVILPQKGVFRTHQKIVQHFIVGHQNIWCIIQHRLMICDNAVFTHGTSRCMLLTSDIHTDSNISTEFITAVDQFCDTLCLVCCQSIHRIDNERFNSPFSTMLVAILQDRVKETFGFTGTGASSNQRGSTIISGQSLKSFLLMYIRKICRVDCFKASRHLLRDTERQTHSNIRLMVNRAFRCKHFLNRTFERFVRHRECGFYVVPDAFL